MLYLTGQASTEPSVSLTPGCMDSHELTTQSDVGPRVMGLILSIAACLIISTNLLVAVALLKLLIKRSSQSWCFVLNLALADTLVGVAITGLATEDFNSSNNNNNCIPRNQHGHITADHPTNTTPPAQGKSRCLMRMAFVTSPCTASIMSMFLISLDRYAAIKMPLRYSLLSGRGTAVGSLLTLWISSLTVGFMPVMVRQLQTESYNGFCAFFSVIHGGGIVVLYSTCFFPVLSVFIYIYLDILKIACSHQKQICRVRQAGSRTTDHHHHGHQHYQNHHQHQQLRSGYWSHVKALRTVAVLVGCFLVLWCPFFVVCIVHILCESCELKGLLENHLWLLGLSNSLINPLVYAFWQREVRLQLAAMFSCFKGRSSTAGPPGIAERHDPSSPVQTQAPSLLRPITCNNETHTVVLSSTTTL
ncbi:glucose-dependent insulinotropic receptor [Lates calcarifer]|uniref:G protein-coupled receptor 119 n=1 Tax=Lates calcarifer TaxID=8187 RepID=A0A4W6FM98_LATCA|nr:glucose-dependent insulinotropic receptor [Lates calcarifer]